ncbi:RNA 2',3'-cyclic phosphodiesterase [Deinococcus irradiatisoli]|uniref:RNA 2',3'-cyclic phosphodiesterase n=1 Tax=Deinococcus irradiatisoli TaxID=2202254 RepID=A0A2Z3JBW1_9DEIO|nr:RNA 2',3'-cyclic phosphodiesterase [Deinococcus irradiatisoli]AWN22522.1 RNA 2',3'-cyclic phosphodiesterase [Deinococcus irradiatisoli]
MTGPRRNARSASPRPANPTTKARPDVHEARPRLFYALKVPPEVAEQLAAAQKDLRGNWRSVRADQLHVTLAYLPGVDPGKLAALKQLGDRLTEATPPLSLRLRGTGYFPNEGSPRVWFVKVEAEGLDDLAARLRTGLAELGVQTDELPFKAHITLARKKGAAPRLPPKIFDLGWDAGAVTLYRSHLQKTGPVYENLSMFKFRGSIMSSAESAVAVTPDQPAQDPPSVEDTP